MDIILENGQPRPAVDNVVILRGKEDNVGPGVFLWRGETRKYQKVIISCGGLIRHERLCILRKSSVHNSDLGAGRGCTGGMASLVIQHQKLFIKFAEAEEMDVESLRST